MQQVAPPVRYLGPPSGPWLIGRLTEVLERAIAISEAGRALGVITQGASVEFVTIDSPGRLSHTRLKAAPWPDHEGVALSCGIAAVSILCPSQTGSWQHAAIRAIERLAKHDREVLARWRAVAERLVIEHRFSIARAADALLQRGTLTGTELRELLEAAPDPAPTPHASEQEDEIEHAELQRLQKLAQLHLRRGL